MKRSNLLVSLLLALAVGFTMSCKDKAPDIGDGGGIAVGDGFYITQSGVDPVATSQLKAEQVAEEGFASKAREGFYGNYVYLTAGNYVIVNVVGGSITTTYGGAIAAVTDTDVSSCGFDEYFVVSVAADGAAFNVAADGLYKVTLDVGTGGRNEALLHKIEKAGLIGTATDLGWGGDTDLPLQGTITADGATWEGTTINMKEGEYKLRFNCRWVIDRLIDPAGGLAYDNGYIAFTNFGGSAANLLPGNEGPNIQISAADQAQYTITVNWTPADGFSMTLTRTGDYVPPAFDPADHPWGVRGTAGIDWGNGIDLYYKNNGGTHTWVGMIELSENVAAGDGSGEFKITDGATWLGVGLVTDNTGGLLSGTDNLVVDAGNGGFYYIIVTTADEGTSYSASIAKGQWSIIGSVEAGTNWDNDLVMTESGSSFTLTGQALVAGEFKFRANADWLYNLGGDMTGLSVDGANLTIAADGTYDVTLTTADKGVTWTATVQ